MTHVGRAVTSTQACPPASAHSHFLVIGIPDAFACRLGAGCTRLLKQVHSQMCHSPARGSSALCVARACQELVVLKYVDSIHIHLQGQLFCRLLCLLFVAWALLMLLLPPPLLPPPLLLLPPPLLVPFPLLLLPSSLLLVSLLLLLN